jgi:hypothetical protein
LKTEEPEQVEPASVDALDAGPGLEFDPDVFEPLLSGDDEAP